MARVLIVDDSALARRLLGKMLEKMNHEVVGEAESGEKSLILYNSTRPDIVTMDLVMPGIGGLEASKKILSANPDAKIIITSAHMQNNQKSELLNIGINFLVLKPIEPDKLTDAINKIMSGAKSNINMDDTKEKELRTEVRSRLSNIAKDVQEKSLYEENELCVGDKVSVSHCFSEQPLAASVIKRMSNVLTLTFEKKIENYNFNGDDPITICFVSGSTIKICEAVIVETITKEICIRAGIEAIYLLNDDAISDRFPASLLIDFKMEYNNKKQSAIIKEIGPYNMRMVSRAELETGDKVSFDIFLDEKVVTLNAEIVSMKQGMESIEYELKTTFIDLGSKKLLKLFVGKLMESHEKNLGRLHGKE